MPSGFVNTTGVQNVGASISNPDCFPPPFVRDRNYTISGVTRNGQGAILGSCVVHLFLTATDVLWAVTTSDASGNYSFTVPSGSSFYAVAYLVGSPDLAGTTVNTLAGT